MPPTSGESWFLFCIATLAVWRLTHLLQAEDGPFDLVVHLRSRLGAGYFGQLLDCFYCLSIWVAAPAAGLIGSNWRQGLLLWLALSAAAILVERLHAGLLAREQVFALPAVYSPEAVPAAEDTDDLLHK